MSILIFVEHQNGAPTAGSLGVISKAYEAAQAAGTDLTALVAGSGVADIAAKLGDYGVATVYVADDARFADPAAGPLVDAVVAASKAADAQLILASASVVAADVVGGVAGRLGIGINTDGTDIRFADGGFVFDRPALDDSVIVSCGWADGAQGVGLFRAGSFSATSMGGTAAIEALDVPDSGRRGQRYLGVEHPETGGVDITKADVLIGAGRGLGGPEKFELVESLAKMMGGEVATTRAVVDAGWYDYSTQVGQTGKTVTPKLYIAVGISGAIQHKIGMQASGTIVAINKDPHAPIFDFADFGIVGDLFEVVPQLEAKLQEQKG